MLTMPVQRRGHRVSWQTIGVNGAGRLGTRVEGAGLMAAGWLWPRMGPVWHF